MLEDIVYVIIYGLVFASLYGIMTVGFSFICGLGGFYDIALPAYLMVGAFVYVILHEYLSAWALPLVVFCVGIVCLVHYLTIIKRIREDAFVVFFATIFIALIIQSVFEHLFTISYVFNYPPLLEGHIVFLGVKLSKDLILGGIIGWSALFALKYLTRYTNIGRAIIAIPQSIRGSQIIGIDITRVQSFVYFVGGLLLGLGAYFYGSYLGVNAHMWIHPLIIMFTITVTGGLGSIDGVIFATLIIGVLEVAVVTIIDPRLKSVIILAVGIVILVFRPKGFAGIRVG
jgi:branched-chain amino acid transport system permease protein